MSDPTHCPSCGHAAAADDRFCPRCGTAIPRAPTLGIEQGPVAPGTSSQPAPPQRSAEEEAALEERLREALSPSFLLVRRLGTGGMASVWLAREPALRRLVAVKLLTPELAVSPSARARFEREAQAVAGLVHPNVVGIHGLGALADDTPYFVMQHVGGKSLAARLEEEGPLDPDEARRITGEVAGALAAAHAKGIIHRDIKPANVLYDDETGRVLVSDFGIAAVRPTGEGRGDTRLTQTGMIVGTPQYMSPEQLVGEEATDRTDVYALGLLAYELVAGTGPFQATTPQALIAMHLRDVPKPLSAVRLDVDPEFERLVAACLEKDPARRPSAADIAKQLAPGGGVALEWPPPGLEALHGAMRRWSRRFWTGGTLVAGVAVAFAALEAGSLGDVGSPLPILLVLAAALGTVVLCAAAATSAAGLRRASRAVHRGYTWRTVLETLTDVRGDTGALIAGAREYARLHDTERNALRRFRVARAALHLAGGVLPVLLLFPAARAVHGASLGPVALAALVFGPCILALAAAGALGLFERQAVRVQRAALARRRRRDDPGRLVEPWYVSFDSVRGAAGLDRGREGRDVAGWLGGTAAAMLVALAALVAVPLWLLAVLAPQTWMLFTPKWNALERRAPSVALSRRYALPADRGITPLEAGTALYALDQIGRPAGSSSSGFTERPLARRLEALPELHDAALFPTAPGWLGPDDRRILALAVRGFSPAQRQWLERFAAHPAWKEFTTVARAPDLDYIGARFVLPFAPDADASALPVLRFAGTKVMAYANTVRAAYLLSQGRRDEAERALRETVSLGILLVDHGRTTIDVLIGVVIAGIGRGALEQFYTLTGRAEGPALREATLAMRAQIDSLSTALGSDTALPAGTGPRELRRTTLAIPGNASYPLGIRFEAVHLTSLATCTDLREILFGPAKDVTDVFARARRELARFRSDSALIGLMERDAWRGPSVSMDYGMTPGVKAGLLRIAAYRAMHATGRLLGNPRFTRCADLVLLNALH